MDLIERGAGEDFLHWDFQHGRLPFLEHEWDLRGIGLYHKDITFPRNDSFENIDFAHAKFYRSSFEGAYFYSRISFAHIQKVTFKNCTFHNCSFYGTRFEDVLFVNCDFAEGTAMTNCILDEVKFERCFLDNSLWSDCYMNSRTSIGTLTKQPVDTFKDSSLRLRDESLADVYGSIKDGYQAGGAVAEARSYLIKERTAYARHNAEGVDAKVGMFLLGMTTGFGVRPVRVLATMMYAYIVAFLYFLAAFERANLGLGPSDVAVFSAGAFFTFGYGTDLSRELGALARVAYVVTAFTGIGLTALFVTVLANVWFSERPH